MFAALAGHLPLMQGACSGWHNACWAAARAWLEHSVDAGELGRAALLLLLLWCSSAAPVREGSDSWLLYIAAGYSEGLWSKRVLAGFVLGCLTCQAWLPAEVGQPALAACACVPFFEPSCQGACWTVKDDVRSLMLLSLLSFLI